MLRLATPAAIFTLLVLAPIPNGSAAPWTQNIILMVAVTLVLLWMREAYLEGRMEIVNPSFWMIALIFLGVAIFQLVPLPPDAVAMISPKMNDIYMRASPEYAQGAWKPLSANSRSTMEGITIVSSMILLMFVVIQAKDGALVAGALAAGVLTAAGLEAALCMYQYYDLSKNVWSNNPLRASGTYINANHLAGLLIMAAPVAGGAAVYAACGQSGHGAGSRANGRLQYGALVLLMALILGASLLSFSRGGLVSALTGGALLAAAIFSRRRYMLGAAAAAIYIVPLLILFANDGGRASMRYKSMFDEANPSFMSRLNLYESGLEYFKDFQPLGSGLNTFRHVFEIYQAPEAKDKIVSNIHNDWLQLFCETGLIGGMIFLAGFLLITLEAARRTRAMRNDGQSIMAYSMVAGAFSMGVFSISDFNVSHVTANAMTMALLLAAGYRMTLDDFNGVRAEGRPGNGISIPRRYHKYITAALFVVLAPFGVRAGMAAWDDVSFNMYLDKTKVAGGPYRYFFIRRGTAMLLENPGNVAVKAQRAAFEGKTERIAYPPDLWLDGDYRVPQARALAGVYNAMLVRTGKSIEVARNLLAGDADEKAVQRLASTLLVNLEGQEKQEYDRYLEEAERAAAQAVALSPAQARLHYLSGLILMDRNGLTEGANNAMANAVHLAPNSASILYDSLRIKLALRGQGGVKGPGDVKILEGFRQLLTIRQDYGKPIYQMLAASFQDKRIYFMVTPYTWENYMPLYNMLAEEGDEAMAFRAAKALAAIARGDYEKDGLSEKTSSCRVYQSLSMMARYAFRGEGQVDLGFGELAREMRAPREACYDSGQLMSMIHKGEYEEAATKIKSLLLNNWNDADTLLAAAALSGYGSLFPGGKPDQLGFLAAPLLSGQSLSERQLSLVEWMLSSYQPRIESEELRAKLLKVLLLEAAGEGARAVEMLDESSFVYRAEEAKMDNRHLLYIAWGDLLERRGDGEMALEKYSKAVEAAPNHLEAMNKLIASGAGEKYRQRSGALTPEIKVNVSIGGALTLLGYTVLENGKKGGGRTIRFHWRADNGVYRHYRIYHSLIDKQGKYVSGFIYVPGKTGANPRIMGTGEAMITGGINAPSDMNDLFVRIVVSSKEPPLFYNGVLFNELGNPRLEFGIEDE